VDRQDGGASVSATGSSVDGAGTGGAAPPIERIAIVGAGTIGLGWAVVFSRAGFQVTVSDSDQGQLDRFRDRARSELELCATESAGVQGVDVDASVKRIKCEADLSTAVADADYVQECTPEQLALKQEVFRALNDATRPDAILASSASALPPDDIFARIRQGGRHRCLVAHPTNPPHVVPLVEIVAGSETLPMFIGATRALLDEVGQTPILCRKPAYGFVLNRLQMALFREALHLARDGVASVADIDRTVSEGLGLRWALLGPYGVEATNAAGVRDDLEKFGDFMVSVWRELNTAAEPVTEEDIRLAVNGVAELWHGCSNEELAERRNRFVLRVRAVKAGLGVGEEVGTSSVD
jgi:3-hydroxyacyl-CoA dehydrogenase